MKEGEAKFVEMTDAEKVEHPTVMSLEEAQEEANLIKSLLKKDEYKSPSRGNRDDSSTVGIVKALQGIEDTGPSLGDFEQGYWYEPSGRDYEEATKSLEKLVKLTEDPAISTRLKIAATHLVIESFNYMMAWPRLFLGTPLIILLTFAGGDATLNEIQDKAKAALRELQNRADRESKAESRSESRAA